MKLYYKPGSCSLAPHIVSCEAGLSTVLEKVDTKEGRTATGADYRSINKKGYVPALLLDSGELLTEAAVVCQYLADRAPEKKLMAPAGTVERYRQMEWFNYISTELHKGGMNPLFNPRLADEAKQVFRDGLRAKFDFFASSLSGKDYLLGDFTAPDAYAFTVLNWTGHLKIDLSDWPAIGAYLNRVRSRPAVVATMQAEGLIK